MIIEWVPCYDHRPAVWTQPEKDKIVVTWRGKTTAIDLSDDSIVEYEIEPPVNTYVHKAWREDGVLHVQLPTLDRLSNAVTIDHGEKKELTWTGSNQSAERKQI